MVGYNGNGEKPLAVKKQVQDLIGEATGIENLAQGELLSAMIQGIKRLIYHRLRFGLDAVLVMPPATALHCSRLAV